MKMSNARQGAPNKRAWAFIKKWHAPMVVAGAFAWSAVSVATRRIAVDPPGTIVLRLGHYQLEPMVREALDEMARRYSKMRRERDGLKVRIAQVPIPESTYGQWMSSQLMAGTAPDIVEHTQGVPRHVIVGYYTRYFHPVSPHVAVPNPHNAGNQFSNTAWRATFQDGMRAGYVEEMQEYMTVPLSQFGTRIFYNRDLLEKLTGLTEPPREWQAFKRACNLIKSQRMPKPDGTPDPGGRFYTPIAASSYHFWPWDWTLADPLSFGAVRKADYSRDGWIDSAELFTAMTEGRVNFLMRPYAAKYGLIRELTEFFQPGFTGLGRDDAVFLFAQEQAVFITTGTADQGALREQAEGVFNLGIMNFPFPSKDDPDYGDVVEGPAYERPTQGFMFGVTRTSRHPEIALDFLHYLSSLEVNEEFNAVIYWLPAVLDARLAGDLKDFKPNFKGVYGSTWSFTLGGDTATKWAQVNSLFQVGQLSYEKMMVDYAGEYKEKGGEEFMELVRNDRRGLMGDERVAAGLRARMVDARVGGAEKAGAELAARYLRMETGLFYRGAHYAMLMRVQAGDPDHAAGDPYEMTEEAKNAAREKLREKLKRENENVR